MTLLDDAKLQSVTLTKINFLQQIQSNFVVVIHPGSRTLRIGRATDTLPVTIPHVIARRHKQSGQPRHEDAWLLREGLNVCHCWPQSVTHKAFSFKAPPVPKVFFVPQKPESNEQRQNGLKMVDQAIWSKKMSNGVRRTPVSAEQVCVCCCFYNIFTRPTKKL